LVSENGILLENLRNNFKANISKEKELNQLIINLDAKFKWEREKVAAGNTEILYINTKLKEKDHILENLKSQIDKYTNIDLESTKEVYLADPKKNNINLVNEMAYTKEIITKITAIYENEKKSSNKIETMLNVLMIYFLFFYNL